MGTAMVVDGQNLLMRAVFAAKNSAMSHNGIDTGPLVIFANTLAKHVREERPERMVVVWDGGTSAARQRRLPSYKASRKSVPEEEKVFRDSSFDLARTFCALCNVPTFQMQGVEADDLIAGAWAHHDGSDKIVILSSDKDFLQLVGRSPRDIEVEQVRLSSAGTPTDRWTYTRFCEEYHFNTWHWPLIIALAGDTGDGVPGVPGIGPVKAQKLLERHNWAWSKALEELGPERAEIADASRYCVDLWSPPTSIPVVIPSWRPTDQTSPIWSELIDFLSTYELKSIMDRVQRRDFWADTEGDVDRPVGLW